MSQKILVRIFETHKVARTFEMTVKWLGEVACDFQRPNIRRRKKKALESDHSDHTFVFIMKKENKQGKS